MSMEMNNVGNNEAAIEEKAQELQGLRMVLGNLKNMQLEFYKPDAKDPAQNGIPEWVAAMEKAQADVGRALVELEGLGAHVSYNSPEEEAWVSAAKEGGE